MDENLELKLEFVDVLEKNILAFWLKMQDNENGGFYGQMRADGVVVKTANKGAILHGRILWAFSAAFRLTGRREYLLAALHAYNFVVKHFIDKRYGGVYWEVDYQGNPTDTKKQFYAIAFVLYGLAEFTRATGNQRAFAKAVELFEVIEKRGLDPEYNGYREACTRNWKPIKDMRLSELDENYPKTQNTHLHIMEAYTNLYKYWRNDRLKAAIGNLINIFTEKILNKETYHLDLFFNDDWSRGKNQIESYGHDIECSWLIHDAVMEYGEVEMLDFIDPIVVNIAKAAEKGLNPDGSMIHEANLTTGHVDTDLHWWVQAEAVIGYYNVFKYYEDAEAEQKALKCWKFIKEHIIDWDEGEWFWGVHADGTRISDADKAGFWKCPYHNSRMCIEMLRRIF